MKLKSLFFTVIAAAALQTANGAIVVGTTGSPVSISVSSFDILGVDRGTIPASVSSSQSGGVYTSTTGDIIASVASGSASGNVWSLTITNDSGQDWSSFTIGGTRYQYKDNSSNNTETISSDVAGFDIAAISNNGDSTSNGGTLTGSYSAIYSTLLAAGNSLTITWSDANDGGTDAMFGFGGLTITPTAVPEPAAALFGAIGMIGLLRRRRF